MAERVTDWVDSARLAVRGRKFRRPLYLFLCAVLGVACLILPDRAYAGKARAPLFKSAAASGSPDTLEVFCLYVEFKAEDPDEPTTTGLGTFGSAGSGSADPDHAQSYTLDPNGSLRRYRYYLEKHFDFARNYFEKVSGGRVTIKPRIFPPPDSKGLIIPYQLAQHMKAYNPSELDKAAKQKTSDFNAERAQSLMSFVYETAVLADKMDSANNPFKIVAAENKADSLASNTKTHRCYLLFHAGHSRLLDGGQLGALGANTPNDFTDFFVTQDLFHAFDSATTTGKAGGPPDKDKRKANLGVKLSTGDTLKDVMMLSEAASQEKVNWGINGILVNQLARQMGMPDMFDVNQGISELGSFCLMDYAGYNTMNGFLPVYPSAWVRAYMGWDDPVTARPSGGPFSEYKIFTPTSPHDASHTTLVKVPLNDREYLLVENRQRAAADSTITITFSKAQDVGDKTFGKDGSITVPFAKADSIFLDSICDDKGRNCKVNTRKPEGVITGSSSYDLGLPGSGLLVWHVNEWFISEFLKVGAVNAYLGDTLRSQYKGVELVEADGSLSLGKAFKDQLGQAAADYGSGSDMLPHLSRRRKDPPKDTTWADPTTLDEIGPYGQANTNAWNDGRTHIRLVSPVPDKPLLEKGMSGFSGDSIFNIRDSALSLRVYWPNDNTVQSAANSAWPAKVDPSASEQSLIVLKQPSGADPAGKSSYVVSLSDRGLTQAFTPAGLPVNAPLDTLHPKAGYDSVTTLLPSGKTVDAAPVPVASLAGKIGKPIGSAVLGDTLLAALTADAFHCLSLRAAGLSAQSRDSSAVDLFVSAHGLLGPVAAGDRFWIVTRDHRAVAYGPDAKALDSVTLPDLPYTGMAAYPSGTGGANGAIGAAGSGKPWNLALTASGGQAVLVDAGNRSATQLEKPFGEEAIGSEETFTVSASDFDRDGHVDLFLLGSRGAATLLDIQAAPKTTIFNGWPQRIPRSAHFVDTVYKDTTGPRVISIINDFYSEDKTSPALADLDGDGHPDIIFSGANAVFALNFHGAFLKGWPFQLETHQNVGFTYGGKLHPETAIRSTPLALSLNGHPTVLIGSPDGLILAVDSLGRKLTTSSFDPSRKSSMGVLSVDASDWPLTMGGLTLDSNDNPDLHLTLADLDGDGQLELVAQSGGTRVNLNGTGTVNVWTLKKSSAPAGLSWGMAGGNAARQNYLDASALGAAAAVGNREVIEEFYLFPSPLRGPEATVHLRLGAPAAKARIRVYNLAGNVVKDQSWNNLTDGLQAYAQPLDLHLLAPDVYSALVEVSFPGGKQKKWIRFGVIR